MITVPARRVKQFGVEFYQAGLSAKDIDRLVKFEVLGYSGGPRDETPKKNRSGVRSRVNWDMLEKRIAESETAYQRPVIRRKIDELVTYYKECKDAGTLPAIPGAVIITSEKRFTFTPVAGHHDLGLLQIPEEHGVLRVLDGQHRLLALHALSQAGETVSIEVPAVLFDSLDARQIVELFVTINAKHTRLNPSHIISLAGRKLYPDPNQALAHDVIRSLNEDETSPLHGEIKMLGTGRLAHAPAPGAEHLDLAVERRGLVLVERADHVGRERLVRIRIELAAREADDVRRVQARVLGVDRHEELDDLPGVERVEEDGGHLDGDGFAPLAQRVEGEQAVLAVEHAEHAVLFGDLQQPEVVVPRDRGEGEALLGGDDDRAGDRGQRTGVLALLVVGDQLVDLAADDRPLVGGLALGDPLLEHVPVHPRPHARAVLLRRLVPRAARVAQHLELHEPIDVLRREAGLVELDPELLYAARRDSNHRAVTVLGRQTPVNRGIFGL